MKGWLGEKTPGQAPLQRARTLRHHATESEKRLWSAVRSGRLNGCKIRRQVWLGRYIVDFVCLDRRVVIEVDDNTHAATTIEDAVCDRWLEREGFRVLRFTNADVLGKIDGVTASILTALTLPPASPAGPSLFLEGRGAR